ncbi:MAG: S9 family peptidase [Cryomorphaceae bacterium]|mgnify:FL=1|jgi:oligopeptidase B|nr:S9 family peptidase [Cryomorphaceae bacterium]MBT3688957.1 S9 family peptidase [Cryomorphaceae bacterium]MBT4221625.1 S9 family peptidase [Cryomorphaceae bacterium]MBT4292967.1 S9 family peptidase [Cryomorphaceae bacterium]MBT4517384.1 S9 family peptidase [Cryomorphaceae bacterium]
MRNLLILSLSLTIFYGCSNMNIAPPIAVKKEKKLVIHDDARVDNYYWLNDRENPEVISYLEEENKYTDALLKSTKSLQERLFNEMKSRIKEDDNSVPYFYNDYWYTTKYEKGKDYPVYTRKYKDLNAEDEIILDVNSLAKGYKYFRVSGISISPDNKKVAYGVDTLSRRIYTIKVKNLVTNEMYSDNIDGVESYATWAADSETIFYTGKDIQTLRSDKIYRHKLDNDQKDDVLVFEEKDETFSTYVYPSKSREYIMIGSGSTMSSEFSYLSSNSPLDSFKLIQERERGLEYRPYHFDDMFYISTNIDKSTNFKLVKTPISSPSKSNWEDVIPHRDDVLLEEVDFFRNFMVIGERNNGLLKIRIKSWDGTEDYYIGFKSGFDFEKETYNASIDLNPDYDTNVLRYNYTSLTTPYSVIDYNVETQEEEIKKQQEVLGGKFDSKNYTSERLFATAHDGIKIPISIVRHVNTELNQDTPILQYGYGSYGITIDPSFSSVRLSLLDRGFVFAIAHIRGSQYLGRPWYENGRMLSKKNTFRDFVSCSKFLIENNYTSKDHLYAEGGSAGGLLMGAIMNMAPEIYNGVISAVPFVDVITTMLDETIPLTSSEYDEWGNPNDKEYYDYMKSYSPYDNVRKVEYPNTLVTTGLHDSQVQYWEPAKWVAKLRTYHQGDNMIMLHTNMNTGHSGASGRFEPLKEIAMEYAFLFMLEDIK